MISSQRVTVGTTATPLNAWDSPLLRSQKNVEVLNLSLVSVFLGGPGVTPATGRELTAGKTFVTDVDYGEVLFACSALGGAVINVFQQGT